MATGRFVTQVSVLEAGHAEVQDLGRPGLAGIGVTPRGVADQGAARVANILVGNPEDAPLIETTASTLRVRASTALLAAATGAADVLLDGHHQPARETLVVAPDSVLEVRVRPDGFRAYLAFNGRLHAPTTLGSVASDPVLRIASRLEAGDVVALESRFVAIPTGQFGPVFRFGVPASAVDTAVGLTAGPDLGRLGGGATTLRKRFRVLADSDQTGLRLAGPGLSLAAAPEIRSRGVPVGAVEVSPAGDLLVLLRGRLVTAGYPVVAVVTSTSLDRLGQLRPGGEVRFAVMTSEAAARAVRDAAAARHRLAERVREAFRGSGMAACLHRPSQSGLTR